MSVKRHAGSIPVVSTKQLRLLKKGRLDMGVLACSNRWCENVMCDRYSEDYGYICDDCFDVLVQLGPTTSVHDFMNSQRKHVNNYEASLAYFDKIFPSRLDEDY